VTPSILLSAGLAGATYTLIPGPAFLALLGIGAARGRKAGAGFLAGHFAGDILWATLALVAIIGAHSISRTFFDWLGLICGCYLCWLGFGALRSKRDAAGRLAAEPKRPLLRGLTFGLTNPKGYPVSVAMFTALLSGVADRLDWNSFPLLLLAACAGFIIADVVLVVLVGTGWVRRFYARHDLGIARVSGLIFIGFGIHAIVEAVPGLVGRRA
jgi:threonine/homoserine/homoserine lactone efflux protein